MLSEGTRTQVIFYRQLHQPYFLVLIAFLGLASSVQMVCIRQCTTHAQFSIVVKRSTRTSFTLLGTQLCYLNSIMPVKFNIEPILIVINTLLCDIFDMGRMLLFWFWNGHILLGIIIPNRLLPPKGRRYRLNARANSSCAVT